MSAAFENIMKEKLKDFSVNNEGQFCGHCDSQEDIDGLLTELKCIGYSYSVRHSVQLPKNSDAARGCPKFFLSLMRGNVEVRFFGHPFSVESGSYRECILGPKYYKDKSETAVPDHLADHVHPKKKRICVMDTRKSGCPATFSVKCIRIYPEYSIESEGIHPEMKKKILGRLREDYMSPSKITSLTRFYVVASPPGQHTHNSESVKGIGSLHPLLVQEIVRIVKTGTTSVKVIKMHLEKFVGTHFSAATMPERGNTMFYPGDETIYNYVYSAVVKNKKSPIDQDALQGQINEWESESPGHKFHFRPCGEVDGEVKPLLFCYQTGWQQELLKRYGRVCLLDATYKTTKYDMPLFFITVKANVCYLVVGFFFVQVENTRSICEALNVFKTWNTDMNPVYWVTDFSESEINAIQEAFPLSKVYLCAFHREQAWLRWLQKKGHLTVANDKDTILDLWRHVAASPSSESFKDNIEKLKTHAIFNRNPKAVIYFEKQWVQVYHRWVKAFEDKGMFASVNTTNGAEAMNKLVKYSHLRHNSDQTLTGVVMVLVNSYLPSLIQKYSKLNSAIKSYSKEIPLFLHGKTPEFTKHVMKRYASAENEFTAESVTMVTTGLFCVESASTKDCNYIVNFTKPDCTCLDFQKFKYPCKHFCAVFHFTEWGFENLNISYRTNPLICFDTAYGIGTISNCSLTTNPLEDTNSNNVSEEGLTVPKSSLDSGAHKQAREMCKTLSNMTYNCTEETAKKIIEELAILQHFVESSNPSDNGLPLVVGST